MLLQRYSKNHKVQNIFHIFTLCDIIFLYIRHILPSKVSIVCFYQLEPSLAVGLDIIEIHAYGTGALAVGVLTVTDVESIFGLDVELLHQSLHRLLAGLQTTHLGSRDNAVKEVLGDAQRLNLLHLMTIVTIEDDLHATVAHGLDEFDH